MDFSIIFEAQVSHDTREEEQTIIREGVEQALLAEELGFDRFWTVEHHSLVWYAHMSAPEVFLPYIAARTSRIRVGHGVVCLPFPMNHPIRVAERIAMLDILSNGRVDFGTGRGATRQEVGAFGMDQSQTQVHLETALRAIPKMWRDDYFEFHSDALDIPLRPIRPRPVQKPHPPLFLACTRPETITLAGTLGVGALLLGFNGPDDIAEKRRRYEAAVAARQPGDVVGEVATHHVSALCPTTVLDDPDEARRIGLRGQRFFVESLEHWYGGGPPPDPERYADAENLAALLGKEEVTATTFGHERIEVRTGKRNPNQAYGDVSDTIAYCERLEAAGADEIMFLLQMGTIPQSVVLESMHNIGTKVIPHFRKPAAKVFAPA